MLQARCRNGRLPKGCLGREGRKECPGHLECIQLHCSICVSPSLDHQSRTNETSALGCLTLFVVLLFNRGANSHSNSNAYHQREWDPLWLLKVKTEKLKGGAEKVRKKQRRALEAVTAKCGKLRLFYWSECCVWEKCTDHLLWCSRGRKKTERQSRTLTQIMYYHYCQLGLIFFPVYCMKFHTYNSRLIMEGGFGATFGH